MTFAESHIKHTTGRCPVCAKKLPSEVFSRGESPAQVYMRRRCPEHGESETLLSSDARFYWLAKGSSENGDACCPGGKCGPAAGAGPEGTLGKNAAGRAGEDPFETLSTCVALIEIVNSCNLACPTCFADSPQGVGEKLDALPLANLKARIEGVVARKGVIDILQLSGGEPTLHPEFFDLLSWAAAHPKILYTVINTNGVKIAGDTMFAERLDAAHRAHGKFQIYLQFDGTGEAGQVTLRGADLRAMREKVVARCGVAGIPVTLAMVVTPENLGTVWDAAAFGLKFPHVRGVTYQPMFTSGRVPVKTMKSGDFTFFKKPAERLNTADILLGLMAQSAGKFTERDFTPLPCGDPNCATIGYLLRFGDEVKSVGDFVDFSKLQGFLRDKIAYKLEDLAQCGCESEPLGDLLKQFELRPEHTFRIFIKPFMDAGCWDEDRIDRCCTHVIRPDGKLDSFCRYYSGFTDTRFAPK